MSLATKRRMMIIGDDEESCGRLWVGMGNYTINNPRFLKVNSRNSKMTHNGRGNIQKESSRIKPSRRVGNLQRGQRK